MTAAQAKPIASEALAPQPTHDEFDAACELALMAESDLAHAQEMLARRKDAVRQLVEQAKTATGAKSLKRASADFEAVVTYGQKVEIVPETADKLHKACVAAGRRAMFRKLIAADIRYRVQSGAAAVLERATSLKPAVRAKLEVLLHLAMRVTATKPSVKVKRKAAASS